VRYNDEFEDTNGIIRSLNQRKAKNTMVKRKRT
jgi:hypothetical protein